MILVAQATCIICSKSFYVRPNHLKRGWGKYCSIKCRTKAQFNGENLACAICGKNIHRSLTQLEHSESGKFFCSVSCKAKWRNTLFREEKHSNWINGINVYRKILIRTGKEQICSCCHLTDTRVLVVHHIDHDRENNDESNLTWVCHNCHFLIHHDKQLEIEFKKRL